MAPGIIWWIVVGLIAGWGAGKIMKGGGYAVLADIVLGIIGGIVGGWAVGFFGGVGGGMITNPRRHSRRRHPDLAYPAH